ncbi:hypothetical protein HK22_06520 [Gluconobacter sp. DsW_056]|uniref:hypothetical protein n=1 Tax=Gluconobacter cerinus TaxID=38307 RepID=UPI000A3676F4|nr:hypothetical protein [Gluconobacter cerinus]MBS1023102.1 hypothetical protein [Gluconobacter cerinus]MBS1025544.1 hypothetical protein [Gluconobacter cerinus]OUI80334.1 hypothetical protein HK22_06520 [Gluconobacter sp. DsW_056]
MENILFHFLDAFLPAQTAGRDNGAPSRARAACGRTIVAARRPVAGPVSLLTLPASRWRGSHFALSTGPWGSERPDCRSTTIFHPGVPQFRDEEAHDCEGVARSGQETLEIIQSYAGDISAMFKGTLAR